ncbi:Uncharacterised protein [Mycobacteroides abscessus subsp. abscessus]|nr:Uncharacterised protein [Mycobacteroides abscessus subsp. abscessus]
MFLEKIKTHMQFKVINAQQKRNNLVNLMMKLYLLKSIK